MKDEIGFHYPRKWVVGMADQTRPRDEDALRAVLRAVRASTRLPVLFAGVVHDTEVRLSEHLGTRTAGLRGLHVLPERGLGGRALVEHRPAAVADYERARTITHDYDVPVLTEGLRSMVAVPVVVNRRPRALLYGAVRESVRLGTRVVDGLAAAAEELARELAIRDEVDRRLSMMRAAATSAGPGAAPGPEAVPGLASEVSGAAREELRELHAELRLIADDLPDPALRERLRALGNGIAGLTRPPEESGSPSGLGQPMLSTRELDVLTQVALGCTNAEAASRLSLSQETVKSYLRSAMRKLDASTRHEAVVTARRLSLLP